MSSIRLIATDLDFTLLNEHFVLTETTKEILSRILDSGVEFVPCSSRPLFRNGCGIRKKSAGSLRPTEA